MHRTNPSRPAVTCQNKTIAVRPAKSSSTKGSITDNPVKEKMEICSPTANKALLPALISATLSSERATTAADFT